MDELKLALLLDELVNDLNNGVMPKIYTLMESDPELAAELAPLVDFSIWFKAETAQIPEDIEAKIEQNIITVLAEDEITPEWSMQRLVQESEPDIVARGEGLGLTPAQLEAISVDETPVSLDNPKEIAKSLANKYQLGRAQFSKLLNWILQLTSGLQPNNTTSMIYARGDKKENNKE